MEERQNTLVCTFDPLSPRISVYEIHKWIHEQPHVAEATVTMIQIDGPRRQVFIKFVDLQYVQEILQTTKVQSEYKHSKGEISLVRIEVAGMVARRLCIANLPPAIDEGTIRAVLAQYSEIRDIREEKWPKAYRYAVANGIRIVVITLTTQIPSHLTIRGRRVLTSYEGQPMTCYSCGDTEHIYRVCPRRRSADRTAGKETTTTTWADIAAGGLQPQQPGGGEKREGTGQHGARIGPVEERGTADMKGGRTKTTQPHSGTTERTHENTRGTASAPDATKDMINQWAVTERDVGDSMEQEKERMDDDPTNAAGTDRPRQPVQDHKAPTTKQENRSRERGVQEAQTGNPSLEPTWLEETRGGEDTQISPKRLKQTKIEKK
jgi:hypothetical protein